MPQHPLSRRGFLTAAAVTAGQSLHRGTAGDEDSPAPDRFQTVGIILYPWEVAAPGADWPARAAAAGVTTIGLHAARRLGPLLEFIPSPAGRRFLADCRAHGVAVEYELHAVGSLLSRELFYRDETLFRADPSGRRTADFNLCSSNPEALRIVAERAREVAAVLAPTTGRYFYWTDDAGEKCHCPRCRDLSFTDQAVLTENAIVTALRERVDPSATLAHLAYHETLTPPAAVEPHPALFLEFAPIRRDHAVPLDADGPIPEDVRHPGDWMPPTNAAYLELLDRNLAAFPAASAQVLEYYLDASYFARWRRPAKELPFDAAVVRADAALLAARGVGHLTTFALWLDADHERRFGRPPLDRYAAAVRGA